MDIVECQREGCNVVVVYNQKMQMFLCDECGALYESAE